MVSFFEDGAVLRILSRIFPPLKPIKMDFLSAINKGFDFCPPLARCRLLNKSSLQSTRLIIRKPKIDSAKNKVQTEMRLLLEYAAKKFFPEKVDVRGT